MVLKLLLFLLRVLETLQHLTYPINFCNMASTCIHDSRVVCASSPDGCTRRSFLDQCDMYEYNCDYGTQYMTKVTSSCTSGYQETYILFCGTLLTSTQITQISSNMTEDPTDTETSKSSTKELTQTLPENVTSKSDTEISPDTVPLTLSTTTLVTTSIINHSKENGTNNTNNDTTVNPSTHVYCCDRPLTWETTTEVTRNYEDNTINDNSEEHKTNSEESSSEYNVTNVHDETTNIYDNNITFTTINQKRSDPDTIDDTTIFVNTETKEALNHTTTEYCCNRPFTWETTTEVTKKMEDITNETNNSEDQKLTEAIDTNSYTEDTSTDSTTSSTLTTKKILTEISFSSKVSKNCHDNCQRPITWLTTRRGRKHYWN